MSPTKSEFLGMRPRHKCFFQVCVWFKCVARTMNQGKGQTGGHTAGELVILVTHCTGRQAGPSKDGECYEVAGTPPWEIGLGQPSPEVTADKLRIQIIESKGR